MTGSIHSETLPHNTQGERIRALEVQVTSIQNDVRDIDHKLDELLALRSKGAGAFWLATILMGTGVIGFISQLFTWIKGT